MMSGQSVRVWLQRMKACNGSLGVCATHWCDASGVCRNVQLLCVRMCCNVLR